MTETTVEKITRNRLATIICTIFVAALVAIILKDFYLLFHEEKVSMWFKVREFFLDSKFLTLPSFLGIAWYSIRWCFNHPTLARPIDDRIVNYHVRCCFQENLSLYGNLLDRLDHGIDPSFMGKPK